MSRAPFSVFAKLCVRRERIRDAEECASRLCRPPFGAVFAVLGPYLVGMLISSDIARAIGAAGLSEVKADVHSRQTPDGTKTPATLTTNNHSHVSNDRD